MAALVWTVDIDWDADTNFTNEAGRLLAISVRRGREQGITEDGYTPVDDGVCYITLDNYDGRYDPYNAGGALYGYILPNRDVSIIATVGATSKVVFTGKLRDIRPQNVGNHRQVRLSCTDGIQMLKAQRGDNLDIQTDYKVSDAITALVGSIVPVGTIEDNLDTIDYWWGDPNKTIYDAINELAQAFRGEFYIDTGGYFQYKARSYSAAAVKTITQTEMLKDMELYQPWDEIKNDIRVVGYPRVAHTSVDPIWALIYKPLIAAGETLTVWANYAYESIPCPATAVDTPIENTDYEANTLENGTGTDKSAQIGIVMTEYATEAKLEITNNDAADVYLTLMKLQGDVVAVSNAITCTATDSTSITNYGKQSFQLDSHWIQNTSIAQLHADSVKLDYSGIRRTLNVRLEHQIDYQFLDLFQAIDIEIDKWNIDQLYILAGISHDWVSGGGCITTLHFEPHPSELTGNLWFFTATFGDVLGW